MRAVPRSRVRWEGCGVLARSLFFLLALLGVAVGVGSVDRSATQYGGRSGGRGSAHGGGGHCSFDSRSHGRVGLWNCSCAYGGYGQWSGVMCVALVDQCHKSIRGNGVLADYLIYFGHLRCRQHGDIVMRKYRHLNLLRLYNMLDFMNIMYNIELHQLISKCT